MRRTITLIALSPRPAGAGGMQRRGPAGAAGADSARLPTAETPVEPVAVQLPAEFVGVYTASLPAADTPGRDITVALEADGAVIVTSDYLNNQPPIVETGTWSANPSGTVTVVLTKQGDQTYFEPRSFLVGVEEGELLVMGDAGQVVRFARSTGEPAAEPAAAAPSSEEAPAVTTTGPVTTTIEMTTSTGLPTTIVTITETMTVTSR